MIIEVLAALAASFAFGILFNIKGKNLIFASIGGGLAWFIYKGAMQLGQTEIKALFLSSIGFSIYSEVFARILKTPVTTIVISALIPLVPGGGMYDTMVQVITGNLIKASQIGIKTLASAGTLALGVIFISTLTKIITKYNSSRVLNKD